MSNSETGLSVFVLGHYSKTLVYEVFVCLWYFAQSGIVTSLFLMQ